MMRMMQENPEDGRFFAYPNRSLLLPLLGLKIAGDLEVKTFAMTGRFDEDMRVYRQAADILRGCETKTNIVFTGTLERELVEKALREKYGSSLKAR